MKFAMASAAVLVWGAILPRLSPLLLLQRGATYARAVGFLAGEMIAGANGAAGKVDGMLREGEARVMKRDAPATAFQRGCNARYAGTPIAECPYPFNSTNGDEWRDGWKRVDDTLAKQPKQPAKEGA